MKGWLWAVAAGVLGACDASPPDGVAAVVIDPTTHWEAQAAFTLTPPVRLPTQAHGRSRTTVRIAIPSGAAIDVDADGRLRFPLGTVADRVEEVWTRAGWLVADVRGTELTAAGERFHLLRPERPGAGAALAGFAWARARPGHDAWVHDALATDMAEDGHGLVAGVAAERREAMADGLRARGGCARCHEAAQPEHADARALVHRGTDAQGWYVPQSVLADEALVETYRAVDANEGPFVTATCGDGRAAERAEVPGGRRWRCADGGVARVRFDLAAALQAGDAHAAAVCASRRWLAGRFTERARQRHAAAIAACEGTRKSE